MFGPAVGGGGLGRYVEQLTTRLLAAEPPHEYTFFLKPENLDAPLEGPRAKKVEVAAHWYTLREQTALPRAMDAAGCDLLHFPHWNVPLGIRTPFVVTIHDLILLEEPRSARVTTRHPLLFRAKYAVFRHVLAHALRASVRIIAVSETTKAAIRRHFPDVPAEKIEVIYEGVSPLPAPSGPPLVPQPYLLAVGNAYPHKNLDGLLAAFARMTEALPGTRLVLAGREDVFRRRLKASEAARNLGDRIAWVDDPTDDQLSVLYRDARAFVFPSRVEGFGLPALEAVAAGIPVAAARAGSLPEILGEAAAFFDPNDTEDMARAMQTILQDEDQRKTLVTAGLENITRFSWDRAAAQTTALYARVLNA